MADTEGPLEGVHNVRHWALSHRRWPPDGPAIPGPGRRISGTVAVKLGATYAIDADLSYAKDALEQLLDRWADLEPPNDIVVLALWHAAVVAYARPFGGGRRSVGVPAGVVPDGLAAIHDEILALRNWVITHPVSGLEVHSAGIDVAQDGSLGVTRVMRAIPGLPSREFVERFADLVDRVGAGVFEEELKLHAELYRYAETLTTQERLALPDLGVVVSPGGHGTSRRRGRSRRAGT